MNNEIKTCCIDSRKSAIMSSCGDASEKTMNMIDDYFKRLEEFASTCNDVADFEAKFPANPLSQEYTNLFTKVVGGEVDVKEEARDACKYVGEDIADSLSLRARRETREKIESGLRGTPVVGDVMTAKQHFDFFNRFRKKKDD